MLLFAETPLGIVVIVGAAIFLLVLAAAIITNFSTSKIKR
jgi:hypothetical protein